MVSGGRGPGWGRERDGGFSNRSSDLSPDRSPDNAADDPFSAGDRNSDRTSEKRGPTLKARAVGYLSRREYARGELARKLGAYTDDAAALDALLDDLEREGWLSTHRFAESLVHRRAERQGAARIVQELRQNGVDEVQIGQLRDTLRATEYDRAMAVWNKRFGERPADRAAYAKQARFLAARGFAHDVIHRVLGDDQND